tara:strand:- start:776 stop:1183 length:408 start_codon:yes stop_codon:yes gene_type:complete
MANYVCSVRSNYVRVKDEQAFKDFIEDFDCELIRDTDGRVGFVCGPWDGGGPHSYSEEYGEYVQLVDCEEEIGRHLCEGEVLVIEEVGSEKMRYLVGISYAYNHKGECLFVSMASALREKVAAEWGAHNVSAAAY